MRPFSPWKFIIANKARSLVICLMMACITVCFIGGMYVDHPLEMYRLIYDHPQRFMLISPSGISLEIRDEYQDFKDNIDSYLPEGVTTVSYVPGIFVDYETIMGFENDTMAYIFGDYDELKKFNEVTGTVGELPVLKDGEVLLSRDLAGNWGVKKGDMLEYEEGVWEKAQLTRGPLKVAAITDTPGIVMLGVSSTYAENSYYLMAMADKPSDAEGYDDATIDRRISDAVAKIKEDYPHVRIDTDATWMALVKSQLEMMNVILWAVTAIMALVLSIMINAAFSALYDKRRYEFSIYKAMGFTDGQIFRKVLGEVLILDAIGLLSGLAANGLAILIINFVLRSRGLYFFKVSTIGIICMLVCNLVVIIPVVILNMRRVRKYDVTVY